MSDWTQGLPEWEKFAAYHRERTLPAMQDSAYVMSLVPRPGEVDVKFAVELGMAIMLGKPIIAIAQPGTEVPAGLRKVADAVIVADLDTEEGREHAQRILKAAMGRLS